jgi:hypothetical protein
MDRLYNNPVDLNNQHLDIFINSNEVGDFTRKLNEIDDITLDLYSKISIPSNIFSFKVSNAGCEFKDIDNKSLSNIYISSNVDLTKKSDNEENNILQKLSANVKVYLILYIYIYIY